MIDMNVHGVLEEHTRMLVVIHAAVAVAWSVGQMASGPFPVWTIPLFLASALRGVARLGTGRVRVLLTVGLMTGLVCTAVELRSSSAGLALTIVLIVLCAVKLAAEKMGRRPARGTEVGS